MGLRTAAEVGLAGFPGLSGPAECLAAIRPGTEWVCGAGRRFLEEALNMGCDPRGRGGLSHSGNT